MILRTKFSWESKIFNSDADNYHIFDGVFDMSDCFSGRAAHAFPFNLKKLNPYNWIKEIEIFKSSKSL
jgi:hypothetical protein